MNKKQIKNGIYLVIDPAMERQLLLSQLEKSLAGTIAAVQLWDNFLHGEDMALITQVVKICRPYNVPVLINNRWKLAHKAGLDGVHFDVVPHDFQREEYNGLVGITCGNDLATIQQAVALNADYISFCSMFPSATANSCELVSRETIIKARELTNLPIFLAGGITPQNIDSLSNLPYNGIAVVSGIMKAAAPAEAIKEYQLKLHLK
jgi:thiamine-phosphate pyrophosphorylase